jgi:DNA mismatch repair protein MutS
MSKPKSTPMIQQYLSIKEKYKDAILFYRMGDFYEMFFEDAEVASKALEITLTSRNKNDAVPVPMCGVPYRAAQAYIARLIEEGHKVAICDQVEDPAMAKGLVRREVTRVVTPGMIIDNELLDAKSNNYLLALTMYDGTMGIACLDISTATFRIAETTDNTKAIEEVQRIDPSEVLLPATMKDLSSIRRLQRWMGAGANAVNWLSEGRFNPGRGRLQLIDQMGTRSLEGFGCQDMKAGLGAAGALLGYVQETQKQSVSHIRKIAAYSLEEHLVVDAVSRQNLELEKNIRSGTRRGTLISILDKTVTAMGGRRLKRWLRYPLRSAKRIGQRLDAVEEMLTESEARNEILNHLKSVYDLERLNSKIALGHANARDLKALQRSLESLPAIWLVLARLHSEAVKCQLPLEPLDALAQTIDAAIRDDAPVTVNDGGMIKKGYHEQLDELIRISKDGKGYLAQLEVREKEATGISTLKVRYNKVFGYYLEVPKTQVKFVPDHYVRKQTLVNAERYITDELKQFETKVLGAQDERCVMELSLFNQILEQVRRRSDSIQAVADFISRLDCIIALTCVAEQNDYSRPRINAEGRLSIRDGRHPVVEKMIRAERFVPNTIELDDQSQQVVIITGPNMAGKSTVLRQVALIVIMTQMGSFVPAHDADVCIVDRIFTRVGALDNLSSGQSTFMVEMEETANILNHAGAQSLVIMDEIGRGTSTYDGLSIAWAVAEYLHDVGNHGIKTLFATHYHELTELAESKPRVKNFNIAVKEWNDQIIFLRKLVPGGTNRSYGIQVARLAGIPDRVIRRSKTILNRIEGMAPDAQDVHAPAGATEKSNPNPVQLDLFQSVEREVMRQLGRVDINTTTPIEALALLQKFQQLVSGGSTRRE